MKQFFPLFIMQLLLALGLILSSQICLASPLNRDLDSSEQEKIYVPGRHIKEDIPHNTNELLKREAYRFAVEEGLEEIPSIKVIETILKGSEEGDLLLRIAEARLHLTGLHPEPNKPEAIRTLETLAPQESYAAYMLGQYFEGKVDGIRREAEKAIYWYKMASKKQCQERTLKWTQVEQENKGQPTTYTNPAMDDAEHKKAKISNTYEEEEGINSSINKTKQISSSHTFNPKVEKFLSYINNHTIGENPWTPFAAAWGHFLMKKKIGN